MSRARFWIRRDREAYFLSGVIITCAIGAFVSAYWHFNDRVTVRRSIKMKSTLTKDAELKKLRDVQFRMRQSATSYYRVDEETSLSVPKLGQDD